MPVAESSHLRAVPSFGARWSPKDASLTFSIDRSCAAIERRGAPGTEAARTQLGFCPRALWLRTCRLPALAGSSGWGHGPRGRAFRRRGLAGVPWPEPVPAPLPETLGAPVNTLGIFAPAFETPTDDPLREDTGELPLFPSPRDREQEHLPRRRQEYP